MNRKEGISLHEIHDLYGIVICDRSIVILINQTIYYQIRSVGRHHTGMQRMVQFYIQCCFRVSWGLQHAMEEFDEIIQDPDYLKFKHYIREVVEQFVVCGIQPDHRKRLQALCYHTKMIDFTVEMQSARNHKVLVQLIDSKLYWK